MAVKNLKNLKKNFFLRQLNMKIVLNFRWSVTKKSKQVYLLILLSVYCIYVWFPVDSFEKYSFSNYNLLKTKKNYPSSKIGDFFYIFKLRGKWWQDSKLFTFSGAVKCWIFVVYVIIKYYANSCILMQGTQSSYHIFPFF